MACSKEEIERKRLAALQKIRAKVFTQNNEQNHNNKPPANNAISPVKSHSGPVKTSVGSNSGYHPYAKPQSSNRDFNMFSDIKVVTATIGLISEQRFKVNMSQFSTPLINICKTIHSRSYDINTKVWSFSISDYQEFISKVQPLAPHVALSTLPSHVLKILNEQIPDPVSMDLSPIENTLRNKLMPFQEEGVRFAIARRGRCMIADDMGLGKTYQALAVASYYRSDWPLLIVTTSSMRETWQSKIHELLPSVPMMNIVTLANSKDSELVFDEQTEIVIISYKIASMHTDMLKNKKFGVLIVDESHKLKSTKAQCTSALALVGRGCRRVLLLSGTPALSRPSELYAQLALIEPGLFRSYVDFGTRYCAGKMTNFGWDMTGQSNSTELQIILQKRFLIRRTKDEVLTELGEKTRESVLLDRSLLQFSEEEQHGLTQMAQAYSNTDSSRKQSALISYFSQSAKLKIPAVCKYIKQLLRDSDSKFLVFAHHLNMIEAICYTLDEAETRYICIVGSTPPHTRADLVDKFQQTCSCRCAVLSITAASAGLTLTAADLVLFAELHWNPGILIQAEARAHRLGREGAVCARYLLARGTADDYMWPLLQEKLHVLNNIALSGETLDATVTHQKSQNNITQYLSPNNCHKNKNDFIPGTNIRKDSTKANDVRTKSQNETLRNDDIDESFHEHDEVDDLLACLDF